VLCNAKTVWFSLVVIDGNVYDDIMVKSVLTASYIYDPPVLS